FKKRLRDTENFQKWKRKQVIAVFHVLGFNIKKRCIGGLMVWELLQRLWLVRRLMSGIDISKG
ncbi:hypothetical protein, partial [Bacillus safensis]|uniref:hypothetical protein n=1 Tax=Bacillus safensis TaxID=561879 RepID=UPI001BA824D3